MSMNYDHVVIYGWKVSEDDFEMFSDSLLPYIEGHSDVECRMFYGEEIGETGYAVFGKCLAFADKYNPYEGIELDVGMGTDKLELQDKITDEYYDAFGKPPKRSMALIAHSIYR